MQKCVLRQTLFCTKVCVQRKTQLPEHAFKKGGVDGKSPFFQSSRPFARVACNQFSLDCFTNGRRFFPIMPHSWLRWRQMHINIDNPVAAFSWLDGRRSADSLKRKAAVAVFTLFSAAAFPPIWKAHSQEGGGGGGGLRDGKRFSSFWVKNSLLIGSQRGVGKQKCGKHVDFNSVLPAEADLRSLKAPEEVIIFAVGLPSCVPAWYFADVSVLKATTGLCSGSGLQFQQAWLDYLNSTFQQGRHFKRLHVKPRRRRGTMYINSATEEKKFFF